MTIFGIKLHFLGKFDSIGASGRVSAILVPTFVTVARRWKKGTPPFFKYPLCNKPYQDWQHVIGLKSSLNGVIILCRSKTARDRPTVQQILDSLSRNWMVVITSLLIAFDKDDGLLAKKRNYYPLFGSRCAGGDSGGNSRSRSNNSNSRAAKTRAMAAGKIPPPPAARPQRCCTRPTWCGTWRRNCGGQGRRVRRRRRPNGWRGRRHCDELSLSLPSLPLFVSHILVDTQYLYYFTARKIQILSFKYDQSGAGLALTRCFLFYSILLIDCMLYWLATCRLRACSGVE